MSKYTKQYTDEYIEDTLSSVLDEGVAKSAKRSVYCSLSCNSIKYIYIDVPTEGQCARVRVLTNLMLRHLCPRLFRQL